MKIIFFDIISKYFLDNDIYSKFERGRDEGTNNNNNSPFKYSSSTKFLKEDEAGIDYAKKLLMKKN